MIIAVLGGRGRLGSAVVAELARHGHTVRAPSRSSADFPVDLTTGEGLAAAFDGVAAVVNAVNDASASKAKALLVAGTERVLAAEAQAGVGHHVDLGVVGAERVPLAYYRTKLAQEALVRGGPVPWTLVRATQFHEFLADTFEASAAKRVLPGGRVPLQPIAAKDLANTVAAVAVGEPQQRTITVGGPQVELLNDLAAIWKLQTHTKALRIPVPPLGRTARELRAGALVIPEPEVCGTTTFAAWLRTRA